MPQSSANALSVSRRVLTILIRLNWIAAAFILAMFVASLIAKTTFFTALGIPPSSENAGLTFGMRAIMIGGLVATPLVNVILRRLLAIVETVRHGDPFVAENAERLRRIAWAVLGLEVIHTVIVVIAVTISTTTTPIDIRWSMNITRWLSVLLLFVLARVFEHGTRMRDDLEGTV